MVQLYTHEEGKAIKRPAKQLRGFRRISLDPSQTKTVTFDVAAEKLAFYNVKSHAFVVEPGTVDLFVGSSSDDIRANAQLELRAER